MGELLFAVEEDVLVAGNDVDALPAQPADWVLVEGHHGHPEVHLPASVVEIAVPHHGVGLPLGSLVLLMVQASCLARVPRLPMVKSKARHTHHSLSRSASILLLICRYSVWPLLFTGQALHLLGAPWSAAVAFASRRVYETLWILTLACPWVATKK